MKKQFFLDLHALNDAVNTNFISKYTRGLILSSIFIVLLTFIKFYSFLGTGQNFNIRQIETAFNEVFDSSFFIPGTNGESSGVASIIFFFFVLVFSKSFSEKNMSLFLKGFIAMVLLIAINIGLNYNRFFINFFFLEILSHMKIFAYLVTFSAIYYSHQSENSKYYIYEKSAVYSYRIKPFNIISLYFLYIITMVIFLALQDVWTLINFNRVSNDFSSLKINLFIIFFIQPAIFIFYAKLLTYLNDRALEEVLPSKVFVP